MILAKKGNKKINKYDVGLDRFILPLIRSKHLVLRLYFSN